MPEKKNGMMVRRLHTMILLAVLVAVVISLAFDSGLGTPSAFGIDEFFLLCPLGGLEALLASKSFIPTALISLIDVCVIALLLGRTWCV